jgi:hypothetical protein
MEASIHTNTLCEAEAGCFLSEKPEARGGIAIATSTSGEGFAAKKSRFMAGKVYWYGC